MLSTQTLCSVDESSLSLSVCCPAGFVLQLSFGLRPEPHWLQVCARGYATARPNSVGVLRPALVRRSVAGDCCLAAVGLVTSPEK